MTRTSWGVKVCQLADSPAIKLLYDIYHMQVMEGDIIRTIRKMIQHSVTTIPQAMRRHVLDDEQELNYRVIVHAILETGHAGFLWTGVCSKRRTGTGAEGPRSSSATSQCRGKGGNDSTEYVLAVPHFARRLFQQ